MNRCLAGIVAVSLAAAGAGTAAKAQTSTIPIAGVWVPMGAGRGVDPKLAPPPASPMVLRQPYAKEYESRRAAEAEPVVLDLLKRDAGNEQAKAMLESIRAQGVKPTYGPG